MPLKVLACLIISIEGQSLLTLGSVNEPRDAMSFASPPSKWSIRNLPSLSLFDLMTYFSSTNMTPKS